jgi:hypothetical protein
MRSSVPSGAARTRQEFTMLKLAAVALTMTAIYSDYPAFLKRTGVVEAYTDKGPIVELIVRCPVGTGIMSYSKIERLYCSSKHKCTPKLQVAVANTCG